MKTKITLLFSLILFALTAQAQNADSLFREANRSYAEGNYPVARDRYQKIESMGYRSGDLYLNLGNTYYRLGKLAPAILNYERALKLNPTDEEAKNNLAFVNNLVSDKIVPLPIPFARRAYTWIFGNTGYGTLMLTAVILAFVTAVSFGMYLFIKKSGIKKISFAVFILCLLASVFIALMANYERNYTSKYKSAVVFAENAYVKSEPSAMGGDIFILHEGTKVMITDRVDGWYKVRLADGKIGWMPDGSLEAI